MVKLTALPNAHPAPFSVIVPLLIKAEPAALVIVQVLVVLETAIVPLLVRPELPNVQVTEGSATIEQPLDIVAAIPPPLDWANRTRPPREPVQVRVWVPPLAIFIFTVMLARLNVPFWVKLPPILKSEPA